jgi:hypothetical protein
MSITLKWKFPKIEKSKDSELPDTILSVDYVIEGTDGLNTVNRNGTVTLDPPTSDNFISYSDITNSLMVQWISNRFPELLEAHTINITSELTYLSNLDKVEDIPHFAE